MKQRILTAVITSALFITALPFTVAAESDFTTQTIGNLTYEIPSDWNSTTLENNNSLSKNYVGEYQGLSVTYTYKDLSETELLQQYLVLEELFKPFETTDGYAGITNELNTFGEYAANERIFINNSNDINYTNFFKAVCTEDGAALFTFVIPTDILSYSDYNTFSNISASIKLVTASETEASIQSDTNSAPGENAGNTSGELVRIANLELKIPSQFTYFKTYEEDDYTIYVYTTETEMLQIYAMPYAEELSVLADTFLGAMAEGFESYPGYSEINSSKMTIDGHSVQLDCFFVVLDNEYSVCVDASVNTGTHIINLVYSVAVGDEETAMDSIGPMIDNMNIF